MSKPWIVVADQSQARIFTVESPRGPLVELQRLEHPEAHKHERELVSDRPGRAFDHVGAGRHAMEGEVDWKEQDAVRFAGQIAEHVEKGRVGDRFDRLVLVAGPRFLGMLRQKLSAPAAQLVGQEVTKNLGQYEAREIRTHLPERL